MPNLYNILYVLKSSIPSLYCRSGGWLNDRQGAFSKGKPLRKRPLRFEGMYGGAETSFFVHLEYVLRSPAESAVIAATSDRPFSTEAVWKRFAGGSPKIKIAAPVLSEVPHEAIH